ncbi:MAG: hypothetical protein CMN89_14690 [Sutterellaceae bacterium]|nr:hypothetical protein [Sutterellaceae bacterium]
MHLWPIREGCYGAFFYTLPGIVRITQQTTGRCATKPRSPGDLYVIQIRLMTTLETFEITSFMSAMAEEQNGKSEDPLFGRSRHCAMIC